MTNLEYIYLHLNKDHLIYQLWYGIFEEVKFQFCLNCFCSYTRPEHRGSCSGSLWPFRLSSGWPFHANLFLRSCRHMGPFLSDTWLEMRTTAIRLDERWVINGNVQGLMWLSALLLKMPRSIEWTHHGLHFAEACTNFCNSIRWATERHLVPWYEICCHTIHVS